MTSSHPVSKRLPISCEPCRKRKIKCPRDRRPCQTCIRRGLHPDECIYLGRPRLSSEQTSTSTAADAVVQQELLDRIRNLEDLIQKIGERGQGAQAAQLAQRKNSPVSPPSTVVSSTKSAPTSEPAIDSVSSIRSQYHTSGNVGCLQVSASGHVRYVPLASQWNSVFAKSTVGESFEGVDDDVLDDGDLEMPFVCHGRTTRKDLLAMLPPGRYCDVLKDVFLKVFSPLFHILHDPTFEDEYRKFRHNPDSVSKSWLALLFIVLGIAVTGLDDDNPMLPDLGRQSTVSGNIQVLSSRYRSAAMQCLAADSVVSRHSIRSLQALVLILYARTHSSQPTWTLLGFTHHVAIAMGCHIDPERFGLGPVECEERRRAWAGLIMLYTIQNTSFGSLDARFLSHDVRLPADVDDLDLLMGSNCDRDPRGGPTQMTYLLMKFRLYEISAKICQGIFNVSARQQPSVTELQQEITMIQEACKERYLSDASRQPLPNYHMANLNIIYSYINQLSLLLYRPLFRKFFQGEVSPGTRNARDRCLESARGILAIYKNMLQTPQFAEYKWYTGGLGSFHAFHAAVILAAVLMNPDSHAEFEDIRRLLSESVELFASLSHRSTICSKAVPILRNFLSVVTRDNPRHAHADPYLRPPPPDGYNNMPPESLSPPMDIPMDAFFAQLQPEYWVSPAAAAWDGWDFLAGHFDVPQTVVQTGQTQAGQTVPVRAPG
ncbi:hypothetical protein VTN77DRAFT_2529 [Rasamsonia byssochlamydoides]|uniref:uncharacterized protein n=1 Tax=Rasamsonia byssochlamydoides TaxID=89139 RepID=UPI003743A498